MVLKKKIFAGVIVLIVLVAFFSSVTIVKSGTVGVISTMGAVNEIPLYEGFHLRIPFITNVTIIDVKTQKAEADCAAASKDLQTITTSVAVNYHVNSVNAPKMFTTVGLDFDYILIVPAIQESVKAVIAQYSAEELITNRQEVSSAISQKLAEKISSYGITIELFNITNLEFSDTFNAAIEAKQTAEQEALKAQQDLARIVIEAQQTVTQAQAAADARMAAADAEAYSIRVVQEQLSQNEGYLEYLKIQQWNGALPQVQGDSNAIIDLR